VLHFNFKSRKYNQCEKEALEQISRGNKYPLIYQILAQLYRKSKLYEKEADILKQGIQAQIDIHNPGVAKRDFKRRLVKVNELTRCASCVT
ncbi:hypothetical protein, partial [Lentilactobacillus parafarraginis]|uniref:hypothetical protein n=1 Tax=Lentilactobacillus parafarraginis TaxID=390842 RepID=UPI001F455757